jgi:hypothetical protein
MLLLSILVINYFVLINKEIPPLNKWACIFKFWNKMIMMVIMVIMHISLNPKPTCSSFPLFSHGSPDS